MRAPTPSAAMEIATPDKLELINYLGQFLLKSSENISYILEDEKQKIRNILSSYGFRVPLDKVKIKIQELDYVLYRFQQKFDNKINTLKNKLSIISKVLEANNSERILRKGFVIVKQDSKYILRANQFSENQKASLKFFDNEIEVNRQQ